MTGTATKTNIYDNLLVVLITSLVFGYAGGAVLSPVNFVELLFFPYLLSNRNLLKKRVSARLLLFAILWLSYSVLSLVWASNVNRGLLTIFVYFFRFLMCLEMLVFSMRANRPLESISKGWFLAVVLTAVVALWEILTNHHLAIAREESLSALSQDVQRAQASVLFYNPNTYCVFLVMAFPFLAYKLLSEKKKALTITVLLVLFFIVIKNASRGAILSVGIMTLMLLLFFFKNKRFRGYGFVLLALLAVFFVLFGESLFSAFLFRMETQGMQDGARFEIWDGAWSTFLKSRGFGVGVGSMTKHLGALNSYGIEYAHCLLLESLVEGGVILTALVLFVLFRLLKLTVSVHQKTVRIVLWMALITFPVYSIINSEYLRPAFVWSFFMSAFLYALHKESDPQTPALKNR